MPIEVDEIEVQHDEAAKRFTVDVDGQLAVLDYMLGANSLVITHTGVPPEFRGQGIAAKLTKTALEYAREQGLSVTPLCSYASVYIRRHPEYRDLVG